MASAVHSKPAAPNIQRSFTTPTTTTILPKTNRTAQADNNAETLYSHPSVRVVSFKISENSTRRSSGSTVDPAEEPTGILPWATPTEKVISSGSFEVYRVLEITFFNFCNGRNPRAILPKSQCWCVDGESKFVMKMRDECYRIELPNTSEADLKQVEELKQVLPRVLRYEITSCPFARGFQVDLPEPPKEPVKLRPWKPRQASQPAASQIFIEPQFMEYSPGRWSLRRTGAEEEEVPASQPRYNSLPEALASEDDLRRKPGTPNQHPSEDLESTPLEAVYRDPFNSIPPQQEYSFGAQPSVQKLSRMVTAPPALLAESKGPSETSKENVPPVEPQNGLPTLTSNSDSFRSFHSPISPLPPSPPYSNPPSPSPITGKTDGLNIRRSRAHKRDPSEVTITADSAMFEPQHRAEALVPILDEAVYSATSGPEQAESPTPTLASASSPPSILAPWPESPTPSPRTEIRQRLISRQRSRSPLPLTDTQGSPTSSPSASIYSPTTARLCASTGHHLTTALLQKTCSLLLGPPVQLVALMMNMARKIARGAYTGLTFGYGVSDTPRKKGEKKRIPGAWESLSSCGTDSESLDGRSSGHSTATAGGGASSGAGEPMSRSVSTTIDEEGYDDYWDDDEDDFGMALSGPSGMGSRAKLSAHARAEKLRKEAMGMAGWGVD